MMVGEAGECLGWADAKIKIGGGDTFHVPHTVVAVAVRNSDVGLKTPGRLTRSDMSIAIPSVNHVMLHVLQYRSIQQLRVEIVIAERSLSKT